METISALLGIYAGNSSVTGEFPAQKPVTRSFDFFFDLRLNKRLSKQWWGWWFETPSGLLWRHCNVSWPSISRQMVGGTPNGALLVPQVGQDPSIMRVYHVYLPEVYLEVMAFNFTSMESGCLITVSMDK